MRLYTTASSRENPNIAWAILFAVTSREKFSMNNSKNGFRRMLHWRGLCGILVASLAFVWPAVGQTKAARSVATPASLEQRAEANLKVARENPLQLRQFLLKLPKGGDLHNHLSGAVYAESWIRAGRRIICVWKLRSWRLRSRERRPAAESSRMRAARARFPMRLRSRIRNCTTRWWMRFRCGGLFRRRA